MTVSILFSISERVSGLDNVKSAKGSNREERYM